MDAQRLQVEALIDLALALDKAGRHAQAQPVWLEVEQLLSSIDYASKHAGALRDLAKSLAKTHRWQEAELIARLIKDTA